MRWFVVLAVCAGCQKQAEPPPETRAVPSLPAAEVKRGQDACKAYVDKVCGCAATTPALVQRCSLAHALVDAIQVAADVAGNPEATRRDAVQSNASVRGVVKECIEQLAKLPGDGCT
jgi:hypothetical protein